MQQIWKRMTNAPLWITCKSLLAAGALLAGNTLADVPERIVSAGHSITELVLALGAGDSLIAVDSSTQLPTDFRALPVVGYYRQLPVEGLLAQNPELLVGGEHMGPPNTLTLLANSGVKILQLPEAGNGDQLLENIGQLASVLGKNADEIKASVTGKLASLRAARANLANPPRILFVRAQQGRGLKAAGTGTSPHSLIELAGGVNAVDFAGYKALSDEALLQLRPDWILFSSDQAESLDNGAALLEWQPLLKLTPAGKKQAFLAVDGFALLGGLGLSSLGEAGKLNRAFTGH